MIRLDKDLIKQLIEHCKSELPNEACGILAGKNGSVQKIYKMTNADKSPESFFMDSTEQLKVIKEIRSSGLEMLAIYHSHPHSRAYPSSHDVELAFYPEVFYVIISLEKKDSPVIKAFNIIEGKIKEVRIRISDDREISE